MYLFRLTDPVKVMADTELTARHVKEGHQSVPVFSLVALGDGERTKHKLTLHKLQISEQNK